MPHPRIVPWKWEAVSIDQALPNFDRLLQLVQCEQLVFENVYFAEADGRYEIIFSMNKVSYLATVSSGGWYLEFLLHGPNTESLRQLDAFWQQAFARLFDLEFAVAHAVLQPR